MSGPCWGQVPRKSGQDLSRLITLISKQSSNHKPCAFRLSTFILRPEPFDRIRLFSLVDHVGPISTIQRRPIKHIHHLWMIFPLKPPFTWDFPLPCLGTKGYMCTLLGARQFLHVPPIAGADFTGDLHLMALNPFPRRE